MNCEICKTTIVNEEHSVKINGNYYHIYCILKEIRKNKDFLEFVIDEFDTELRDYYREVAKDEGWYER